MHGGIQNGGIEMQELAPAPPAPARPSAAWLNRRRQRRQPDGAPLAPAPPAPAQPPPPAAPPSPPPPPRPYRDASCVEGACCHLRCTRRGASRLGAVGLFFGLMLVGIVVTQFATSSLTVNDLRNVINGIRGQLTGCAAERLDAVRSLRIRRSIPGCKTILDEWNGEEQFNLTEPCANLCSLVPSECHTNGTLKTSAADSIKTTDVFAAPVKTDDDYYDDDADVPMRIRSVTVNVVKRSQKIRMKLCSCLQKNQQCVCMLPRLDTATPHQTLIVELHESVEVRVNRVAEG